MEQRGLHQSRTPCPAPTCSLLLSLSRPDLCARHRRSALTPPRLSPSLAEDPLPPPLDSSTPAPRLLHRPDLHTSASASLAATARPPWDPPTLPPRHPPPRRLGLGSMALDVTSPVASSGHHQPPRALVRYSSPLLLQMNVHRRYKLLMVLMRNNTKNGQHT
jgi:hypothetical protein